MPVLAARLRLPRRSVRLRLTIIYASLFLASSAGLLAITYVLVRQSTQGVLSVSIARGDHVIVSAASAPPPKGGAGFRVSREVAAGDQPLPPPSPARLQAQAEQLRTIAVRQHDAELRQLLEKSGIALALMAALSIGLGWLAAGRALRPLRTLNERARAISATSLHKRLALDGPDDELTRLGSTFDDLLERLESSFEAQRQFVANASHELRTPLARAQALGEVALGDPDATVASLRASHERVLAAGRQQEQLIEALLVLARSDRGLEAHEPFDVATIADHVVDAHHEDAGRRDLVVHTALRPAQASGDPRLAERLVTNLVDNAVAYNRDGGEIDVRTLTVGGRAVLRVANTGPPVSAEDAVRLTDPFRRAGVQRTGHSDGSGLGLSIVRAIAAAHGATLDLRAPAAGGLIVEVSFPPPLGRATRSVPSDSRVAEQPTPATRP